MSLSWLNAVHFLSNFYWGFLIYIGDTWRAAITSDSEASTGAKLEFQISSLFCLVKKFIYHWVAFGHYIIIECMPWSLSLLRYILHNLMLILQFWLCRSGSLLFLQIGNYGYPSNFSIFDLFHRTFRSNNFKLKFVLLFPWMIEPCVH